jgi:hypothetical protein
MTGPSLRCGLGLPARRHIGASKIEIAAPGTADGVAHRPELPPTIPRNVLHEATSRRNDTMRAFFRHGGASVADLVLPRSAARTPVG